MSKITMPKSALWIKRRKIGGEADVCGDGPGFRSAAHDALFDYTPLVTTDQAEAYAAARVREALEGAAQACEARIGTGDPGIDAEDCDQEARECAAAIRALIPQQ